jgi:hypothetical protein
VTTAKDAVKLRDLKLSHDSIWVLDMEMRVSPKAEFEVLLKA